MAALAGRLDPDRFAFVALSEDRDTAAAARFLADLDLHLTVPLGRGAMQPTLHYPGLPYTLLIDAEGRVAQTLIGELDDHRLAMLERAIRDESGRTPGPIGPGHEHHAAH